MNKVCQTFITYHYQR